MSKQPESRRRDAQLGVRIHKHIKERLTETCKRRHLAVADVVERLIMNWLKEQDKK